jgi:hypothetical protein
MNQIPNKPSETSLDLKMIFRIVLSEIFGDGVMTGKELEILKNIKEIIPIEPETYKLLLSEVAGNLMTEKHSLDDDADAGKIFEKCCSIAMKDHFPGVSEMLLLKRLALALEVPQEETDKIIKSFEDTYTLSK